MKDSSANSSSVPEHSPYSRSSEPILNAPTVVTSVLLALAASYFALVLFPDHLAVRLEYFGAVSPLRFISGLKSPPTAAAGIFSLFSHMFIHAGLLHLGLNCIWLLAFGSPVARMLGTGRRGAAVFIGLFLVSGAAGALFYILLHHSEYTMLVGASGGVSGLLGALVRFAFRPPWQDATGRVRFSSLFDRQVVMWTVVILSMNLLVGVFGGAFAPGENDIAWEAHMGGYLFGLIAIPAAFAFSRGGAR